MKLLRKLLQWMRQHGESGRGFEPETGVRVPKGSPPYGRGAAVAVREPEPDIFVDAVGHSGRARRRSL
jgi:hypothetical protein